MNPYSGLVELFEKKGLLEKQGNRLKYIDLNGEEHLDYRKAWIGEKLDLIMSEYAEKTAPVVNTEEDDIEESLSDNQIEELSTHE
jgi:hypothetical protein